MGDNTAKLLRREGAYPREAYHYNQSLIPFLSTFPLKQRKLLIILEKHKTTCMDDQQFSVSGVQIEQSLSRFRRFVMGILQ